MNGERTQSANNIVLVFVQKVNGKRMMNDFFLGMPRELFLDCVSSVIRKKNNKWSTCMYCFQPYYNIIWLNDKWTLSEWWALCERWARTSGAEIASERSERTMNAQKIGN